jgi:hypothetical protein
MMSSEMAIKDERMLAVQIAMDAKRRLTVAHESDKDFVAEAYVYKGPQGTDIEHLIWMCNEIYDNASDWPIAKLHRWVGYVQGCMVMRGISTLEMEKETVREHKKRFSEG